MTDTADAITPDTSKLKISIAMATYNGAKYIREQLDSLAAQTRLPDELVITDDDSTDDTIVIVEDFAKTAPFEVRIYRNPERLGYSDNFLKAAKLCKGDIVAFCDQDDVWHKNKIMICSSAFADPEVLLCAHSLKVWYGEQDFGASQQISRRKRTLKCGTANHFNAIQGCSVMIRASLLGLTSSDVRPKVERLNGDPEATKMSHDRWIWLLATVCGAISLIPDFLILYRRHGNNVTNEQKPEPWRSRLSSVDRRFSEKANDYYAWAEYLKELASSIDPAFRANALATAKQIQFQALFFEKRHQIHVSESSFWRRFSAFSFIARLRGYFGGKSAYSFGIKAMIKDLAFGVSGVSRLLKNVSRGRAETSS